MNLSALHDSIYPIIQGLSQSQVIISDPNAPPPTAPDSYIAYKFTDIEPRGQLSKVKVDSEGTTYRRDYELTLEVSSYRDPSKSDITNIMSQLEGTDGVVDALGDIGLFPRGVFYITDVPAIEDEVWEERSIGSIDLGYVEHILIDNGTIEQFSVDGVYYKSDGSIHFDPPELTIEKT